ncbi:hypothetical protein POM88_052546 [Heracleum sosnowskyi]|uniref:Transposase-associated domain-containing protein n=1 Tax=Heracleum sosnowskyi TaxID=360622 RepID=A0AAD8GSS7_9APIA|nr:hypothetical protein POM88_052546 [Heracleum sosnowskyi]
MNNDRAWMYQRLDSQGCLNPAFVNGVENFMEYAISRPSSLDGINIQCPCFNCKNIKFWNAEIVKLHLLKKGFVRDYYERDEDNLMYNMVMDAAGPSFNLEMPNPEVQKLYDILDSSKRELYEGCETSQLSAMAQMLSLKSDHHWSEACFDQTSQFFKGILPQDNTFLIAFTVRRSTWKNWVYDCWGEDINMESCKFCSHARYKSRLNRSKKEKKKIPFKRMIYFPLAPRLQSDFPAYSMLSGWKTAGHLACPHCAHDHDAYNLSHGGKTTWFDNHRKFLPANHPFQKNKNWFTKGKSVTESAPPVRTGEDVLQEIESLGLMKVTELGSDEHNARMEKLSSLVNLMSPMKPSSGASPDDGVIADKDSRGFSQFASPKKRSGGLSVGCDGFAQVAKKKTLRQSANVGKEDGCAPNSQIENKRKRSKSVNVVKGDGFAPNSQIMNKRKRSWSANVSKDDGFNANIQGTKTPIEKAGYTDQARMRRIMNHTVNVPAHSGQGGVQAHSGQGIPAHSGQRAQSQSGQGIATQSRQKFPAQSKQQVPAHSGQGGVQAHSGQRAQSQSGQGIATQSRQQFPAQSKQQVPANIGYDIISYYLMGQSDLVTLN